MDIIELSPSPFLKWSHLLHCQAMRSPLGPKTFQQNHFNVHISVNNFFRSSKVWYVFQNSSRLYSEHTPTSTFLRSCDGDWHIKCFTLGRLYNRNVMIQLWARLASLWLPSVICTWLPSCCLCPWSFLWVWTFWTSYSPNLLFFEGHQPGWMRLVLITTFWIY